jgi:hypothetical protein
MKTLMLLVTLAVSVTASDHRVHNEILSTTVDGYNVITHIAVGGQWKTSITIVNLSETQPATFVLNFMGEDGSAKAFTFIGVVPSYPIIYGNLKPGGSVVLETPFSVGATEIGWAQFDPNLTTGNLGGFAIFTHSSGQEAVVPFESAEVSLCALAFDNTNGFGMGVAIVNSDGVSHNITVTVRDENGSLIGTEIFAMARSTHISFLLKDRWPAVTGNRRGTAYFTSDGRGLAVLGLRYNPQGAFTSVHSLEIGAHPL